jgi:uncharacterized protein (TIGR02270 family)
LSDLVKLDARLEANIDGLRIAEMSGWSGSLNELEQGGAGEFFAAGLLAVESNDPQRLDQVIEVAYAKAGELAKLPYHHAYDPWNGLVSALAWVDRMHAASAIARLLETPRPRTRWLGVAACGARRSVQQPGLEASLADPEPMVRARAARTMGELGRSDTRSLLHALLADQDEDCRYWAAWSAARLGTTEGRRALAEFTRSPGARCEAALGLLLRCLPIDRANALLRPLAGNPRQRRTVVQATSVIGDPRYLPWLIDQTKDAAVGQRAGEAFMTITGADLRDLVGKAPADAPVQPNDDSTDESVVPSEDEGLAWLAPEKCDQWWQANRTRFTVGTAYFQGKPKSFTDWTGVLMEGCQAQRHSAALELALLRPGQAMFEVRARGDLQRRQVRRARGKD